MGGFRGGPGAFHAGAVGAGFHGAGVNGFHGDWHGGHFHDGHFHDHGDVDFVFGFGWPYAGWPYYYPYYGYYPSYYPYADYQDYPNDVPYVATNAATNWYYCDNPEGYYPYVRYCNSGWQSVLTTPQG
jgi:hypothetical protein